MKKVIMTILFLFLLMMIGVESWAAAFHISGSCVEHKCCICEKALYEYVEESESDILFYNNGISWPYRHWSGLCEGDRASFLTYEFREPICDECREKYEKEFREVVDNTAHLWLELFRRGEISNIRENRKINADREDRKKARKLLELENEIKKLKGEPYREIYGWIDDEPIYEDPWISSGVTLRSVPGLQFQMPISGTTVLITPYISGTSKEYIWESSITVYEKDGKIMPKDWQWMPYIGGE